MDLKLKQLLDLKSYIKGVDTEVTMILQSLQWNQKKLLEGTSKAGCKYDMNHKIPVENLRFHESACKLRMAGYSKEDLLLPDPFDKDAESLVKLGKTDVQQILNNASRLDPLFKKGCSGLEPLSLERLQVAYSSDERRAIYDAVVKAVPSCHSLADLALASSNDEKQKDGGVKSRLEILAELRDMKRRRTKYRVAAKTRNYSDVLRDVIKTQMEVYSEANNGQAVTKVTENPINNPVNSIPMISENEREKIRKVTNSKNKEHEKDYSIKRKEQKYGNTWSDKRQEYYEHRHRAESKYDKEERYRRDRDRSYETYERNREKCNKDRSYDRHDSRSRRGTSKDKRCYENYVRDKSKSTKERSYDRSDSHNRRGSSKDKERYERKHYSNRDKVKQEKQSGYLDESREFKHTKDGSNYRSKSEFKKEKKRGYPDEENELISKRYYDTCKEENNGCEESGKKRR